VCTLTATYTPTTYSITTDAVTFSGNLSNAALSTPPSVQLTLTGLATAPASTTTLGAFSPPSPIYGQPVTFPGRGHFAERWPPDDNGSVSFYNGATLPATVPVNSTGQASYTTSSQPAGQDTFTAAYAGAVKYASGSTSVSITLTP
jgi:hypothetical protein